MNVVRRVPRNGSASWFRWMFELAVTAFRCNEIPSIITQELKDIANFHGAHIIGEPGENKKPYNGGVNRASRSHASIAGSRMMRKKLPPLRFNDVLCRLRNHRERQPSIRAPMYQALPNRAVDTVAQQKPGSLQRMVRPHVAAPFPRPSNRGRKLVRYDLGRRVRTRASPKGCCGCR